MARPICFVGPWDLHEDLAVVPRPGEGVVLLVESVAKGRALPFHRKKLVLVLSAMRHFAAALRAKGHVVDHRRADTYAAGIRASVEEHGAQEVRLMRPREWGMQQRLEQADLGAAVRWHDDGGEGGHFLLPREEGLAWAQRQGSRLRMDAFYRWMRERTGLLMEDGKPVGGRWSYDTDNRKPARGQRPPELLKHPPDDLTQAAMEQVRGWRDRWASVDGFDWPVTREGALAELDGFVAHRLAGFGDYQDAMLNGEPFLWHARLSPALNLGLLDPREVVAAAVAAWRRGDAPINAVEGFVRQVIGWREFMRVVYWHRMPGLRQANLLEAQRPLPDFYWDPSRTRMRCMSEAVGAVRDHGYAHHIQRLMVLGNFALLAEVRPIEVSHWFWAAFVDAYEWVELPNVHGMALFADDSFTTKPYAASGQYIHKMSNHCSSCAYQVRARHGDDACPFNSLFWRFMIRNEPRLRKNPRLARLYGTWARMDEAERRSTLRAAERVLDALEPARNGWRFDDDLA